MAQGAGEFLADMHQSQHAGMLANMVGGPEALAGGLMSRGFAIGKPTLAAAAGLLGLDPISLGMRAGMGAWNMGAGVMGAGMAGMATMAGVGIAGAGLAFAGHQMASGAQQQMGLNQALGQNFNFMNNQGGRGFTASQGFQIGSHLRGMTHDFGPAGEVATFGELSRLASNMGRMGMAQNVRSVTEFKEKFKEMVTTLKQVATDMGTSMEEAQKFVNSMKGSGIFRQADQLRMSAGTRISAAAGGLAMSEVTGMASIGSQISRSVGGLGRQGAFAGMRTIEQIGVAQRTGAISEEDIYNATGLTGAEGRQALATAQLQQSAAFMSSGRGRRFLASIAGRDGTLNQEAVAEWLSGGNMTTGRTMELAHQNLAGVGRANFIRNEGRLRGAALEQFGGLAQSMVYKQWLSSRGYDANNMDDRAMLGFQRFSGMGRDEADLAIKQLQAMPEMLREYSETKRNMGYSDAMALRRKTTGVEGLRRKFDQVREGIQGSFQAVGAKILQQGTEELESWFNGLMGQYADVSNQNLSQVTRGLGLGTGASADAQYRRYFASAAQGTQTVATGIRKTQEYQAMLKTNNLKLAAMGGSSDFEVSSFGAKNAEFMRISSLGASGKTPEQQLKLFRADLEERAKTDVMSKSILSKFDKATDTEKAAILQTAQTSGGVAKEGTLLSQLSKQTFSFSPSAYKTQADFENAIGRQLAGTYIDSDEERAKNARGISKVLGGTVAALGAAVELDFSEEYRDTTAKVDRRLDALQGRNDRYRAMARVFTEDSASKELISDMFSGGEMGDRARESTLNRLIKLRSGQGSKSFKEYDDSTKGEIEALAGVALSSKYGKVMAGYQDESRPLTERLKGEGIDALVSEYKKVTGNTDASKDDIMRHLARMQSAGGAVQAQANLANFETDFKRLTEGARTDRESAQRAGVVEMGKDGKLILKDAATKGLSEAAKKASDAGLELLNYDFNRDGTLQGRVAAQEEYYKKEGKLSESIGALSMEEKRRLARNQAGTRTGDVAAYEIQVEDRYRSLSKGPGGDAAALSKLLGLNLSKDQLQGINARGGAEQTVASILNVAGLTGEKNLEKDLVAALGRGSVGAKAQGVDAALGQMSKEARNKLQEAKSSADDPSYRALTALKNEAEKSSGYLKTIAANTSESKTGGGSSPEAPKKLSIRRYVWQSHCCIPPHHPIMTHLAADLVGKK